MIDFLFDNPFIAIVVIVVLFNILFGRKKEKKEAKQVPQVKKQPAEQVRSQSEQKEGYAGWIERVQQQVQTAVEEANNAGGGAGKAPVLAQKIVAASSAAHDPASTDLHLKNYDTSAQDYDLTAQDYDITAKDLDTTAVDYDTSNPDAFEFHSVMKDPVDQQFFNTGFQAFHSAHGLSHDSTGPLRALEESEAEVETTAMDWLSDIDEIRRAIIMKEILERPRAR